MQPLTRTARLAIAALCLGLVGCSAHPPPNTLTADERSDGFELLFDGSSLDAWRGFRRQEVPAGWIVDEGTIHFTASGQGGDLITREQFADFELRLEWKISEGGNSGIFFRVTEEARRSYETGPEMQVLDDERHRDGRVPETSAGSNYGLHARSADVVRPPGEWNEVRIVVRGSQVEYWLNGEPVVEYELGSPEWESKVATTKFADWPGYGRAPEGHIGLQDHGDEVWYRNLRIRRLGG